jgi:hypothetical protein
VGAAEAGVGRGGGLTAFLVNPGPFHLGRSFGVVGTTGALVVEVELEMMGCFR